MVIRRERTHEVLETNLSLPNRELLLFILTFLFFSTLPAQVTIKEKVEIEPDRSNQTLQWATGDGTFLLRYGGTIKISVGSQPDSGFKLQPGIFEFPEEAGDSVSYIGPFLQWSAPYFWLESPNDMIWQGRTFNELQHGGIINLQSVPIFFSVCPPPDECETFTGNVTFQIDLYPDSTRAQFPPQDVLDDWENSGGGNPYIENPDASTGWRVGYDKTFKAILRQYNKRSQYVINVIGYSNNYLPIP